MTELSWQGKYNKEGKKNAPLRIELPFQTIETVNESAQERQQIADLFAQGKPTKWRNRLIWGDKKYVLPALLPEFAGKINLIYIDPPFDTGADFSFTAKIPPHDPSEKANTASFVKQPSIIEQKAYRDTWGKGLDSYLQWFYETALLLRELLAEDGSIYVHLDSHIGHYVKCVLDEVFGEDAFLCQIIWKRMAENRKATANKWLSVDDIILVFHKNGHIYNPIYVPYSEKYKARFTQKDERGYFFWDNIGTYSQERLERLKADGRVKFPDNPNAKPRMKNYLHEGKGILIDNIWTDISPVNSQALDATGYPTQKPDSLLERIIKASSNEGDLVLDCFCGSGTTPAVAEKLNRRWITCDLGRFAIHTTRKRLLSNPDVKPFIVQNLGKYERQQWMSREFTNPQDRLAQEKSYRQLILDLYHADKIDGYTWLHGVKKGRMVHIGSIDAPVAFGDVKNSVQELWKKGGNNNLDILGWEFAFELNETARQFAAANKVDLKFKKIPREMLEKRAVDQGDISFFELAALDVTAKVNKKHQRLTLTLNNFIVLPDDIPKDVMQAITHWSQWIDYWAVDFNYHDDTFHNEWQSYRTKKKQDIDLSVAHYYQEKGTYTVVVKVIDILGNDTTKLLDIVVAAHH
ncbi:MAG: site-specific DNA-methyltransferase [Candidatus Parabeggiatoa sp. nov. 3]|nr:MAG: site-specific DNA-methyltransferase [Gammaproteobacteria bacterium]RKZ86649.1 MAG: site-specific DNA-methyltransferase [Gammaproteobacteria bacterium]